MTIEGTAIHYGDAIIIVVYFVSVLFVGLWTSKQNRGSAGGYFLAGRNMHFIPVGASLFASNIGSLHFVGLAGSGASGGLAVGLYELNATFVVLILGYLFLPVYMASGIYTMPEYMKQRFGGRRIQIYLAVLALIVYVFTKISADLYSGAIFIRQSLDLNLYIAVIILLTVAALFTIAGGLTAVIWTDFIQTIIMLIGATALAIICFIRVGGVTGVLDKYQYAIPNTTLQSNTTCGYPRPDYMHMFRSPTDYDFPWPGIVGMTINSIWYWCADQVIVQRVLGARSIDHGKASTILCGYLKLTPLFLIVFPGMIARILYPDTVGCADPVVCTEICGSPSGCGVIAYPTLVLKLMPAGARGLMLAVMLAALMSSLTSIFNSSSTIFAMDLWIQIRKKATEREVMIVGRIFVLFLVVISVLWVTVIQASEGSDLFAYIQKVSSFLQPPMCAIFMIGILWPRLNEQGAFWGMMIGIVTGIIRFAVEYSYTTPLCTDSSPDPRPALVKDFPFLYFSMFLFSLTSICAVVISLLTSPIPDQCLYRLTFWTRHSTAPRVTIDDYLMDTATTDAVHIDARTLTDGDNKMADSEIKMADSENKMADEYRGKKMDAQGDALSKDEVSVNVDQTLIVGEVPADSNEKVVEEFVMDGDDKSKAAPRHAWYLGWIWWLCGLNEGSTQPLTSLPRPSYVSIRENPVWRKVGIAAAVVLGALSVFLHAYFG